MQNIKSFMIILALLATAFAYAQETTKPFTKRVIIKTNVLSLIAKQPTITVEKYFSQDFSTEVSFVQGTFNNFLLTDHYSYNGFLVRAKKHLDDIEFGNVNPYAALYVGNLRRTIQTKGQVDNSGYFGYPSRDFSANSIRGGGSLGISYFSNSRIVIDGLVSLGYGRYTKAYKSETNGKSSGYLDAQVWLSIGYCF